MAAFANSVFNRLEDLPVPTLCRRKLGYALGGGCGVLATDYVWRRGTSYRSAGN